MKPKTPNLKTLRIAILIVFLNLSFSTFAQNYIDVEFSSSSNAVNKTVSGTSNGVDTYKTFEITIPFYSNTLDLLNFKSNYGSMCSSNVMINVNGSNSTYSGHPNTALHKWYEIENAQVGTTYYTVKSLCNGSEIANSRQLIRVVITKEATPAINLTIAAKCATDKNGQNTGYINLTADGSYTNGGKLYIQTTTSANNCNPNSLIKLVNLSNSTSPNNTISNSGFYNCNSNGTYNVKMFYKSTSPGGNNIVYQIPNGFYGWTNYSYTKSFRACMKLYDPLPEEMYQLKTADILDDSTVGLSNPVKEELNLFLNSEVKANYEIEIYDFSGLTVKRASFLAVNSKSINTINVQNLKKGIYIIKIKSGDSVVRKKMIKE